MRRKGSETSGSSENGLATPGQSQQRLPFLKMWAEMARPQHRCHWPVLTVAPYPKDALAILLQGIPL